MRRLAIALLAALTLAAAAHACPPARVVAPKGSAPSPGRVAGRPAPVVVLLTTACRQAGRVSFGADPASRDLLDDFGATVRLRAVVMPGLAGVKLVAIAAYPTGDTVLFQLRLLLRGPNGWQVLPDGPVDARAAGGLFAGDLGDGYGNGIASWQIVIAPGETAIGPHRWVLRRWRVTAQGAQRLPDRHTAGRSPDAAAAQREWGVHYPDLTRGIPAFDRWR